MAVHVVPRVYRTAVRTRNDKGGRARSQQSLFFYFFFCFTVVFAFRTYFCRGSYAPSSASKPATLSARPGLDISAARRDIGIRFTTTDRRDASRDTFSGEELRARTERGRVRMDGSPRNCGCCARDAADCCCLRTVVTSDGGCRRVDGATLNHLRGSWENVPHVTFNAQVRRSSTACGSDGSTRTSSNFERNYFGR